MIAKTVLDFAAAFIKVHLWKWQHVLYSSKNYWCFQGCFYLFMYLFTSSLLPFPTLFSPFLPSILAHSFRPFTPPVLPYLFLTSLLPSLPLVGWFCYNSLSTAKDPNNNSYNLFEVSLYSAWVYLPVVMVVVHHYFLLMILYLHLHLFC
jgi:hypothetical protein